MVRKDSSPLKLEMYDGQDRRLLSDEELVRNTVNITRKCERYFWYERGNVTVVKRKEANWQEREVREK